jgi:hypothetical protein
MSTAIQQSKPAPRRGLSREEAAAYIGISPSKFDELRMKGKAPAPRMIGTRKVWDIHELDLTFDELPREGDANTWDEP